MSRRRQSSHRGRKQTARTLFAGRDLAGCRFPPGDPQGFVDGYVGPRTMLALDNHCALLDEADAAITQHAAELVVSGAVTSLDLAAPDGFDRTVTPIRQSAGAFRSAVINGEVGAVVFKRDLGAFALFGPLFVEWSTLELAPGSGDATGQAGFPVADMEVDGSVAWVQTERGTLTVDTATGAFCADIDPSAPSSIHDVEF